MPTPGVGAQIYVDFGDRINMEDPRYYGEVSKKPVDNGMMVTKVVFQAKDSFGNIKDEFEGFLNSFGLSLEDNKEQTQPTLLQDIINIVKDFNQGDSRWGSNILGTGDHTISDWGCLLTSITICLNFFKHKNNDPGQQNNIFKDANIFNGSSLPADTAIRFSGLIPDYKNSLFGGNLDTLTNDLRNNLRNKIDTALEEGGLVLVHVDNNGKTSGDHWLVVHSRLSGNFIASDPATGSSTLFLRDTLVASTGKNSAPYTILETIAVINK